MRRASPISLSLVLAVCACGTQERQAPEAAAEEARGASPGKSAATESKVLEAAQGATAKALDPNERYAASNILISFKGAKHAAQSVTRSEQEAAALAQELYERIKAGADFAAIADESSDGPERGHGGHLGVFGGGGRMIPEIAGTVAGLAVGEIAPPVRSAFGYHVIRRDPVEEIYLSEILVAYAGADKAPKEVTRTREEAMSRALEARKALDAPGAVFADVVQKYSDHPNRVNGGVIGRAFRGLLPPALEKVAFSLAPGEVGDPVDMPNGVTILRRLPEARVRHILVAYKGATKAADSVTRTKEEAARLIAEVKAKLDRGDAFEKLAESYSDCPSKVRGGDLGTVAEGTMTKRFEEAVFSLKPGERSGIVETEFGFHIMERLR